MSWKIAGIACGLAIMFSAQTASAQRQGGQRQGGAGGFGGGGAGGLIAMEAVQKELGITTEQKEKITKVNEEARTASREGFGGFRDASEDERAKMMEKMTAARKETQTKIEGVLTPEQKTRLKELTVQQLGTRALRTEEVQAELKLSDEQKKKIDEVASAGRQAGGGNGGERPQRPTAESMAAREKQYLDVLTSDQQAAFEKMKGKKFDFPEQTRGGFGGGQGGQGGQRPQRGERPAPGGSSKEAAPTRPAPEL